MNSLPHFYLTALSIEFHIMEGERQHSLWSRRKGSAVRLGFEALLHCYRPLVNYLNSLGLCPLSCEKRMLVIPIFTAVIKIK